MLHRTLRHDFAESEGLVDNSRNLDPIVRREQRQKAAELCRTTWAKLRKARDQAMLRSGHTSNFGLNSGELLVLAAECCAKNGLFDDARDCAEEFFVDDCATSQGSQDQFLCRAKFVQAQVECNNAKPLQGADGVRRRRLAWGYVLDALRIATDELNRPRYDFLVYNAAVVLWDIIYPLLRDGAARYAVMPLQTLCDALEEVDDEKDLDLRVRYQRALGLCYDDAEEASLAGQCLTKAKELAQRRCTIAQEEVDSSTTALDEASQALEAAKNARLALDDEDEVIEEERGGRGSDGGGGDGCG